MFTSWCKHGQSCEKLAATTYDVAKLHNHHTHSEQTKRNSIDCVSLNMAKKGERYTSTSIGVEVHKQGKFGDLPGKPWGILLFTRQNCFGYNTNWHHTGFSDHRLKSLAISRSDIGCGFNYHSRRFADM